MRWLLAGIAIFAAFGATAAGAEQAPDRLKGIGALLLAGKPAEARAKLREVQAAYRAESDAQHDALCSLLLGIADVSLEDETAAESDLQDAATKLESSGDRFGTWFALFTLGAFESGRGRLNEGNTIYEKALAVLSQASSEPFSLETLRAMAPIFGLPAENLDLAGAQPAIARMFFIPFAESVTRDKHAESLIELGELKKAEEELKKAASLSSMFGGMFDASIDAHIGDLRHLERKFDESRASYLKALRGANGFQLSPAVSDGMQVDILGRLAILEVDAGDTDAALAWNDKALQLVRASANPRREASLLQDRANVLLRGSRMTAAESTFKEALKIAEKLGNVHRQASIDADLGALDFFRGDYGRSAAGLEKALALFQKIDAAYEETPVWALLAEDYVMLEAPSAADDVLKKGQALAEKSKFRLAGALMEHIQKLRSKGKDPSPRDMETALAAWMTLPEAKGLMLSDDANALFRAIVTGGAAPSTMTGAATLPMIPAMAELFQGKDKLQHGDIAGARASFLRGLEKNVNGDLRASYLAGVGATYVREGNDDQAISYFEQAGDAIENVVGDLKVEELLSGYLGSTRRWYFDLLIELLIRKGRLAEAFDYAERARARAFLQLVGNSRVNPARGADPNLIREAAGVRKEIADLQDLMLKPDASGDVATKLGEKQEQYNGLTLRMKTSNAEYRSITRVETLPLEEVQKELPPDTTLVSYFASSLGVYAWVIDRDSFQFVHLKADAQALQAVLCWADGFEQTGAATTRGPVSDLDPCSGPKATEFEAFDTLFAPIRPKIRNGRLILIPHGKLHYIPFAALRDPDTGNYLVEDYVLSYAPSASALRFLRAKGTAGQGALVFGEPDTAMRTVPLPSAACEAVSIAGDLGVTPRLGAHATESALYHLDGKIGLVHIAAHAAYNSANPLFSGVLLAPDAEQDGTLEVHEILSTVDLSGVNLIVLSACKTAVGGQSGGDEIVGLTRALLYAGSRDVISTLWDISDPASAGLMEDFYRRFLAGAPAADALQGAQVAMLRSPQYSDPKYWAAFNLTGDPRLRWQRVP
jgi:CHAT domain-containing protein